MTAGARQVLIERDDLERLVELARNIYPTPGLVAFDEDGGGPYHGVALVDQGLDDSDARLLDRVEREVLG